MSDSRRPVGESDAAAREIAGWLTAFVAIGLAVRVVRYLARFPFWGDEAAAALVLLDRGVGRLLEPPLEYGQMGPPGFLVGVRLTLLAFGTSETALRLIPFLAALASVLAFARLARVVASHLSPRDLAIATLPLALFAVSFYPIRYAAELKSYSLDVLVSCLVLGLAARWLCHDDDGSLGALALVASVCPWFSYPSTLFVAGTAAGLLPALLRRGSSRAWKLWALLVLGCLVGTATVYLGVARWQKLDSAGSDRWLIDFLASGFPPGAPLQFLRWLALAHTGVLFAYPNGGPNGGSIATFAAFAAGALTLWRGRHRTLLAVLLAPFALTLAAAALRMYPYGVHPRFGLFLAPTICLVAGVGLARGLGALATGAAATRAALVLFAALGIGQIVRDTVRPFSVPNTVLVRSAAEAIVRSLGPRDVAVALNSEADLLVAEGIPEGPQVAFRWYLRRAGGARTLIGPQRPAESLTSSALVRLVVFQRRGRPDPQERFREWDRRSRGLFTPGVVWRRPASIEGTDWVFVRDDRRVEKP